MRLSRYRRLADAVGNKGGPAGADDGTHRHHIPAAASAPSPAAASAPSPASWPEAAAESELSASSSQLRPRSVPHLCDVGTSPTTRYAAPFVPWAFRASEMFYAWRDRTSQPWMRRRGLVGDSDVPLSPKPSTAFLGFPAQKPFIPWFPGDPRAHTPPPQKPFVKWTRGDPRAHTPMLPVWSRFALANQGASPPAPAPPPPPQSNQDASHPPSPAEASKDCQGFLAQLAFAALVIMGIRGGGLDGLLSGWYEAVKVILVLALIVGAGTLAAGLTATSPVVSTGYTRTLLSTCARFCTCLAAFVLIVDLSVLMGSHGYIVGIMLGLVSVLFSVSVWIMGDPAAYGVYMRARNGTKHLCGCFKWSRQRGPILPT